ncbi:MAG TPA: hypothetical protein VH592_13290 [Gemmataceae bacterium]
MSDKLAEKAAHVLHVAHNTEIGKKAIETIGMGAVAIGTTVAAPVVGTALAPFVAVGALGYGLYRLLKKL